MGPWSGIMDSCNTDHISIKFLTYNFKCFTEEKFYNEGRKNESKVNNISKNVRMIWNNFYPIMIENGVVLGCEY